MELQSLAVPAVLLLICFLAYTSQLLFPYLEPGPLERDQTIIVNVLAVVILICYLRTCYTDPGRVPPGWTPKKAKEVKGGDEDAQDADASNRARQRWCRKCQAVKPPRAHHCKVCQRCIPKMDHHCPWTANCVSHVTVPHFMRFLFYAVVGLTYLEYLIYIRGAVLWENRNLPSYLGPSVPQLIHLFVLTVVNSVTLLALALLFARSIWCLSVNTTTIEGWEIERHETLLRRARYLGGYLVGPDGQRVRIQRQEFPYDIGIWKNLKQGMGTWFVPLWFWPFARSPSGESGLDFEVNGFEDPSVTWPPPDPDRMPRPTRSFDEKEAFYHQGADYADAESIEAFRRRQEEDLKRWRGASGEPRRRKPFHERFEESVPAYGSEDEMAEHDVEGDESGEEGWRNSEGERLRDFGVDEEAEFYDDEDVPLGELMEKRKIDILSS